MTKANTIYYQKPAYICQENELWSNYSDTEKFIKDYRQNIIQYFKNLDVKTRPGTINDIRDIDDFCRSCYSNYSEEAIRAITPYDIYRFVKFGNSILLEDDEKNILGSIFEVGYDTPDRTSYAMRLAINPENKEKNLGFFLVEYTCLHAMERGSKVIRSLIENYYISSFYIVVNKMGWICDGFERNVNCGVENAFTVSLPLTPEGFTSNRIDNNKLLDFIKHNKKGKDYILIDYNDIDKIAKTYDKNNFWVVAVVRKGQVSETDQFVALPVEELQIH